MAARFLTLLLFLSSYLCSIRSPVSDQQQQTVGLAGSVSVSVGEVVVGDDVTLVLYLEPPAGSEVTIQSIEAADPTTWELKNDLTLPLTLRDPKALQLSAAALRAVKSQPVLLVKYQSGGNLSDLLIAGEWVQVTNQPTGWQTNDRWDTIAGFIVGALTSILTILITEIYKYLRQTQINQERIHSLLDMLCIQAFYAAENSRALDLNPIQIIYQTEGLYNILLHYKLDHAVRTVWETGELHNQSVNQRDSLHAANRLRQATDHLQSELACFDEKKTSLVDWIKRQFSKKTRQNEIPGSVQND